MSFARHEPEFSRVGPKGSLRKQYKKLLYKGDRYFVRVGTPLLREPYRGRLQ